MTDKDDKGLPAESVITAMAETWAEMTGIAEKLKSLPSNLPTKEMQERHDELVLRHVKLSYEEGVASGWQAARDHYAPRLTEKEAVEAALIAHGKERSAQCGEPWYPKAWEEFKRDDHTEHEEEYAQMLCALRATSIRFKEEV